jgi:hypothetical protein
MMVAGQPVTVTQLGCSYGVGQPSQSSFPLTGGQGQIQVMTDGFCSWTATSDKPWLTISPAAPSYQGSHTLTFTVEAGLLPDTASLTVAGQAFVITRALIP